MNVDDLQPYLGICVSVLATQDAGSAKNLKDFLVSMPSSKHIEQTLGFAVVQLAEQDLPAFEWVLSHQSMLLPELDLKTFVEKLARDRLGDLAKPQVWQCQCTEDSLTNITLAQSDGEEGQLAGILDQHFSEGERLLIRSVLAFENVPLPTCES